MNTAGAAVPINPATAIAAIQVLSRAAIKLAVGTRATADYALLRSAKVLAAPATAALSLAALNRAIRRAAWAAEDAANTQAGPGLPYLTAVDSTGDVWVSN